MENRWIIQPFQNPRAESRIFCFHHAGAGASIYRKWAKEIGSRFELCLVQLPGREERFLEPRFRRIEPLIESLAHEMRSFGDKNFITFGHSMGSLVSFEWVRSLRREHRKLPSHCIFSGRKAPHLVNPTGGMHRFPDGQFEENLLKMYGKLAQGFLQSAELREVYLPILRDDIEVIETYKYRPEEKLDIPFTILWGREDQELTLNKMYAWRELTRNQCSFQTFAGDHFYLIEGFQKLIKLIQEEIVC